MAVVNPSSLYTEGAVRVDSTPSINFYAQLLAKKQAKKDALDQYYQRLMDTTQGRENQMRPIDIEEGWQNKLNDWQTFYMNPENKRAILNPSKYGYSAALEFERKRQELLADARKSQDRLNQEKQVNTYRLSGKWLPTDSDMDEAHNLSKSIYDPSRFVQDTTEDGFQTTREPNVGHLSVNIPDPTPAEKNQMMAYATGKVKPSETAGTPDVKTGLTPITKSFAPQDIANIATNYANTVAGNRKFMNSYERLMHDQQHYLAYNEVFHKYFPNQGDIQNPSQMAQAEAAMTAEANKTTEMRRTPLTQAEWDRRERIKQADRETLLRMRPEINFQDAAQKQTWIDSYIQKIKDDATSPRTYKTEKGDVTTEYDIPLDPILAKALAKDGVQPDAVHKTPDGQIRGIWYKRDPNTHEILKTKNVASVDNVRSVPISDEAVKLALGKTAAGAKQTNIEMAAPKKAATKTYKAKMPDGSIITSSDGVNWFNAKGQKIQ